MTGTDIAKPDLVYNGEIIHAKAESLSLTDMWKAAGSDPSKQPAKWREQDATKEFVAHLSSSVLLLEEDKLFSTKRGANAGTWAHWQIALSYARYLSPRFHALCNEWCRERMEGKTVSTAVLAPDVLDMIRRDDGISRMLAHKVTGIEGSIATLATTIAALAAIVQPAHPGFYVQGKSSGEIWLDAGLPKGIKNAARWLGNRLEEMGCQIDDCRTVRVGLRKVRQFDPDKAAMCLKNGLLHKAKVYAAERMGQGKLRLVPKPILPVAVRAQLLDEAAATFGQQAANDLARTL